MNASLYTLNSTSKHPKALCTNKMAKSQCLSTLCSTLCPKDITQNRVQAASPSSLALDGVFYFHKRNRIINEHVLSSVPNPSDTSPTMPPLNHKQITSCFVFFELKLVSTLWKAHKNKNTEHTTDST